MTARLTSGLAAAALLTTGLAGTGGAHAADPGGYPHELGFDASRLIAADDAVYAVGIEDDTAYVAEVGAGAPVEIAPATYWIDAAPTPDGSALRVVTSGDAGYRYWNVDTDGLSVTDDGQPGAGETVEALGADAGGVFEVREVEEQGLVLETSTGSVQLTESESSDSASIGAVAARGAVEGRTWYVAGTAFGAESSTATLWSYDEAAGTAGVPVELGAAGDPDSFVESLAVDQTDGVVYALSWRDNDDAPQSYGITAVQDGPDTYLPLRYRAQEIALSPDGETLYLASNDSVLALDTDRLGDYDDEADADAVYVDSSVSALAVDVHSTVFVASDGPAVHAFTLPAAPADLVAAPDSMSTTAFSASWDEGAYAWERDEDDPIRYRYTVRDADGLEVDGGSTWDQTVVVDGLQPGATYSIEIAASNGLLVGEPASHEVTTHARYVAAPSAVSVQGSLTVGGQLSLASTGTWEAGTTLTYEWYGSVGDMGGAIGSGPTLNLTADHLGMTITGVVTGTSAAAAGVTLFASAVGTVATPPVVTPPVGTPVVVPPATTPVQPPATALGELKAPKPKVTGRAKVGKTLTAKPGTWTAGTNLSFAWSANGKAIKGADGRTLTLSKALKGKKISVEVTGKKPGYRTVTKESARTAKVRG